MNDWLPELGDDDLATLSEALEAWEDKDASGEMFSDVVEMMIAPNDPQARAELRAQRETTKVERKRARALRKERSVMLRAKLLTLRERRRVERAVERSEARDAVGQPANDAPGDPTRAARSSSS